MGTRIMVVEDEGIVALSIQRKLQNLGYSVSVIVASGEEAIQQAKKLRPDLALMDIMLAGKIDGIEAARQIQDNLEIPVVYLTANSDSQTLQRAKITEPFGYLLKPFEDRELHTTIEMALYKYQMEQKLRQSERWLNTTLNSIGEAVIATDVDGRIKFMNPVAEYLTGWTENDALGLPLINIFNAIGEITLTPTEEPVTQVLQRGDSINNEKLLLAKDGSQRPISFTTSPIIDHQQQITGVVLVFNDITERKLAEEVLQLARDRLEIQVAERTSELRKANEQLQLELSERKRAEKALAKQAQELARSNAELEQFAYVASHDLREPLRKIKSYTELFAKRYRDQIDEKADKYIGYIVDGAARMQMLVTDLLAYSRTGSESIAFEPTDLGIVVSQACDDLEVAIRNSDAKVTYDQLPTVNVDPSQMAQLFQNLIGNAIKFQGENAPRIHISVTEENTFWQIGVQDNGIGMEPQYADRIFLIFQRLHTRSEYPGTGIGLAICKKIVDFHGGRIWLETETGQGTTFYFTLPKD